MFSQKPFLSLASVLVGLMAIEPAVFTIHSIHDRYQETRLYRPTVSSHVSAASCVPLVELDRCQSSMYRRKSCTCRVQVVARQVSVSFLPFPMGVASLRRHAVANKSNRERATGRGK